MTLERKTLLILLIVAVVSVLSSYLVLRATVYSTFIQLELNAAIEDLARVEAAVQAHVDNLVVVNNEYAQWDDTYAFAQDHDEDYLAKNINADALENLDTDAAILLDAQGQYIGGLAWDPDHTEIVLMSGLFADSDAIGEKLSVSDSASSKLAGIVHTNFGPLLIASLPVLRSNGSGPPVGSFVLGRFLNDQRLQQVRDRLGVEFDIIPANSRSLPSHPQRAVDSLSPASVDLPQLRDRDRILSYSVLRDIDGQPALMLEVVTPRHVTAAGARAIATALGFLALTSILYLLVSSLSLKHLFIRPMSELTRHVVRLAASGDLSNRLATNRTDEIGTLTTEFNALVGKLDSAQHEMAEVRDKALDASRAKSEFLARMSHEIRTPMNGVLGMTELLQGTSLDRKQQRFAEAIHDSAESLLGIINDILDFSKIEAGKLELEQIDFDLRAVMEETVECLASQAHEKGLELVCAAPPDLQTTVRGDPVRLRQVLMNLVGNAVKFTQHGEIVVRVAVLEDRGEYLNIRFEVTDTGVGIDPDKLALIFDSFAQEDGSTTRRYGGTGLGLAISKQLVELMGSEIGVESTPGAGSVFSFTLRMKKSPDAVVAMPWQAQSLAGKRVLIVDDNATNREILEHQLANWRASTESACDADEALSLLEAALARGVPYDLAILDMHMPRKDGLDLARAIRTNSDLADLKLLLLSSVAQPATEDAMRELRIDGQLTKPVRQSHLYDTLVVVVSGTGRAESYTRLQPASVKALRGRILLAEDNPVNQAVAIGMLSDLGIEVLVAANGREAVEKVSAEDFDVVLMDCQMPIMDGFEATRTIRRVETEQGKAPIPVIAVTANALKGDREHCLSAGMDEYLTKPFTTEQLHTILVPFLRNRHPAHLVDSDSSKVETSHHQSVTQPGPPIDSSVLEGLARLQRPGAPDLLQKVINLYLQSSQELKESLCAALGVENAETVRESAHALKSSSANVGAHGLADICKTLEAMGRKADLTQAPTLREQLEHEYERVVTALSLETQKATATP